MYEFIFWMCLSTAPDCMVYDAPNHKVLVYKVENKEACEDLWQDTLNSPDPKGLKSRYICQPIEVPL